MKQSETESVDSFLDGLPPERREAIGVVRQAILDNLPTGYLETMDFGMISYVIPLETYPATYNGHPLMYAALANQKRHMGVYLMNVYSNEENQRWFTESYSASGKKLDMGKACVRFKSLEDLPVDLIGQTVARTSVADFIANYEAVRAKTKDRARRPSGKP